MATFLILPPRELIEYAVVEFATRLLPGVTLPANLAEQFLTNILNVQGGNYLIHREDLPETDDLTASLCDIFGADSGDRIVEIGPPRNLGPATLRTAIVSAGAAAR